MQVNVSPNPEQISPEKTPDESVNATVPVGVVGVPVSVSATSAVHNVASLTATEEGEQLTKVDVDRVVTDRAKFPLLPASLTSPLNAAVIPWVPELTPPGVYEIEQLVPVVMGQVPLEENVPVESEENAIVSPTMEP